MFYDISDPEQKGKLEDMIRRYVIEAEAEHNTMHVEWQDSDKYFESDQIPEGWTQEHKQVFANANDPTLVNQSSQQQKQYVVLNKVLMSHEKVLGDFINGKRMLMVTGRTPKDRRFAGVIQKMLNYIQDRAMMWEEVVVPSIDCGIRRGIHWIKVWFNPFTNLPHGKIEMREISCRDVLIDPRSRGYFYQDARYFDHRQRFTVDDANERFAQYTGGTITFAQDQEYEQPYQRTPNSTTLFCTIHEVQYVVPETKYWTVNPEATSEDDQYVEINKSMYFQALQNPQVRQRVFQQTEDQWYVCFFNKAVGVFYNAPIEYDSQGLFPVINIKSEGRLYPFGSTKYDKNLQDLLNVFISVMLDNAKKGNNGIWSTDTATYQRFSDQIIAAYNGKGPRIIPTENFKVDYPREINPALVELYGMVTQALEEVQSSHALSKGEMPRERLASATVNMLIARDRVSHGRKDVMIQWALTRVARVIYKIMAEKFTEEDWVPVTDVNKSEPEYVPVNFVVNDQEYNQLILEMMGLEVTPEMQQNAEFMKKLQQQVMQARQQFESENEVTRHNVTQYILKGQVVTAEQLKAAAEQLGQDLNAFKQAQGVEEKPTVIYSINDLTQDADIDLVYSVDFNADRDKELKVNRALELAKMGKLTTKRLLIDLEYPDAEVVADEADRQNQALQMGQQVLQTPDLYALVTRAIQALQMGQPILPEDQQKEVQQ